MRTQFGIAVLCLVNLAGCGGKRPPTVAELTEKLQGNEPQAQLEATAWVSQLGPKAKETAPALLTALKSPHAMVRQSAAQALGTIAADPALAPTLVPALTHALRDEEYGVRKAAADTLGNLGPAAQSAIPALEQLSRQPDPCNSAQTALSKIRPK